MRKQERILEQDAGMPRFGRKCRQFSVARENLSACGKHRIEKARDIGDQRRLARARRPHHGQDFARRNLGVEGNELAPLKRNRNVLEPQPGRPVHGRSDQTRKPRRLRNSKPGKAVAIANARKGSTVCRKA